MAVIDLARETNVQHALDTLHKAGVASRYGNYLGGRWTPPVQGRYFLSHSPINTEPLCEFAKSTPGRCGEGPRRRACRQGPLGPHITPPSAPRFCCGSPTACRKTWKCWRSPKPSTTASPSAKPATPMFLWPSTISATSPHASAPKKARSSELDEDTIAYHFKEPTGRGRPDHSLELPVADGRLETGAGHRRGQLRRDQAGIQHAA